MFRTAPIPAALRPLRRSSPSSTKSLNAVTRAFEQSLLNRLNSLHPPSVSLSWLSRAVDLLAITHADFVTLITELPQPKPSRSRDAYLIDSAEVLDICNSLSSIIEKLRRDRLLILLALRLLKIPAANFEQAHDALVECESCLAKKTDQQKTVGLILDLARKLRNSPRGKITTVDKLLDRTIYAVGAATVLVTGTAMAYLDCLPEPISVEISGEFIWSEPLKKLQSEICVTLKDKFSGNERFLPEELQAVDSGVRKLVASINGNDETDLQNLEDEINDLARFADEYSTVLDDFLNGINEFFRAVLCTRKLFLQELRR